MDASEPAEGRHDATEALLRAGFVELVFHCPQCGLGGTSLARPEALVDRRCLGCDAPTVQSVVDRFARG